jgi:hypothetical protein
VDIAFHQSSGQPICAHRLILSQGASLFRSGFHDVVIPIFNVPVLFDLEGQFSVLVTLCHRRWPDPVRSVLEAITRLGVVNFYGFPLSQDNRRALLFKNAAADDVFAMVTAASEFELPVPPVFFRIADVAHRWHKLQDFLEGQFQERVPFLEVNFHTVPLFGLCTVMPS